MENSIFIWKEDEMSRIIQAMRADPKGFFGGICWTPPTVSESGEITGKKKTVELE